jgi:hypothetical protein
MKLTDYEIQRYRLPDGNREKIVWDERLPGFGVHFRRSDANSFVIQYGSGKNRKRVSIGRVGELRRRSRSPKISWPRFASARTRRRRRRGRGFARARRSVCSCQSFSPAS